MNIIKTVLVLATVIIFASCGAENNSTKQTEQPKVTKGEVPMSKQAADLTAASQEAMNRKKMDMVSEAESGMTIAGNKDAKLSTTEPQVAAKPPVKSTSAAEELKAVKVNKTQQPSKPVEAKPVSNTSTPLKVVKEKPVAPPTNTAPTTKPVEKPAPTKKEEAKPVDDKVDHAPFDALLRKHVSSSGKVNYKGLKTDQSKLDAYLAALSGNPIQSSWSRNEKMAYWINMYNAFTIKLIVDNYPVESITKLEGGKPWDKKWIKSGDATYSLNQIENEILRPRYKEAAIHFAVNCAAKSCPPLLNRAWTANNLQANFKKQAKNFINSAKYNKINSDKVEVSKIFDWYKADFGNLIDYLNKYSDTKINSDASINYLEYDWALNE
ncbi:MAG: DUF547 domain-containing protein [Saprospiraceae bacterium]